MEGGYAMVEVPAGSSEYNSVVAHWNLLCPIIKIMRVQNKGLWLTVRGGYHNDFVRSALSLLLLLLRLLLLRPLKLPLLLLLLLLQIVSLKFVLFFNFTFNSPTLPPHPQFQLKRSIILEKVGEAALNERRLWHGTSARTAEIISVQVRLGETKAAAFPSLPSYLPSYLLAPNTGL